jgi:hypothetical protein
MDREPVDELAFFMRCVGVGLGWRKTGWQRMSMARGRARCIIGLVSVAMATHSCYISHIAKWPVRKRMNCSAVCVKTVGRVFDESALRGENFD